MIQKKFKAAVIGCGNIGANIGHYNKAVQPGSHAATFLSNKKTELAALVEVNKKRHDYLRKNFAGVPIFTDVEKMFKEIKPDIVSIATPTASHYEQVLIAAKHRCQAILCEKPISYSIKDARQMINICKRFGSQLFINHQRHFDPLLEKWSRKVKERFIGKPFQGSAYYYNGLFNAATHLIDLLRMFLGDVVWVIANYNKDTSSLPKDLNIDGLIKFKNGAFVSLQSLSKNYGHFGFSLFGEKGMLNITSLAFLVEYRKKIKNKNFKGYFELSQIILKEGEPRSLIKGTINYLVSYLEGKAKPKGTGEDGLAVLKILRALKSSADAKGKKIFLDT